MATPLPVRQPQDLQWHRIDLVHGVMGIHDEIATLGLEGGHRVRPRRIRWPVGAGRRLRMKRDHSVHDAAEQVLHHAAPDVIEWCA